MRLALAVGEVNVDRMLSTLSWQQIVEWAAFYQLEPWGQPAAAAAQKSLEHKLTAWFATISQALYNLLGRTKGQPAYERSRFELKWSDDAQGPAPKYARTVEAQKRMSSTLMLIARAYGADVREPADVS